MTTTNDRSHVAVYSSASVVDTQLLCSLLAAEGIHAMATEVNEPLSGLSIATSEVLVWQEDEARARALIEESASRHHRRG